VFTHILHISKRAGHIGLIIFIVSLLVARLASAEDNPFEFRPILKFTGGIVSAFLIHEGAHALVAGVTGTPTTWKFGDLNQPVAIIEHSKNAGNGWAINSAGLLAQAGCSEFILFNDKIDKNDSFVRGMMFWNIVNPINYAIDYWLIHKTNKIEGNKYDGDISGIEFYSDKKSADIFAGTMLAITTFQAYRYIKTQSWAPQWLKDKGEPEHFNLVPLPAGGALLSFTISF
jgi:hypothetical protein